MYTSESSVKAILYATVPAALFVCATECAIFMCRNKAEVAPRAEYSHECVEEQLFMGMEADPMAQAQAQADGDYEGGIRDPAQPLKDGEERLSAPAVKGMEESTTPMDSDRDNLPPIPRRCDSRPASTKHIEHLNLILHDQTRTNSIQSLSRASESESALSSDIPDFKTIEHFLNRELQSEMSDSSSGDACRDQVGKSGSSVTLPYSVGAQSTPNMSKGEREAEEDGEVRILHSSTSVPSSRHRSPRDSDKNEGEGERERENSRPKSARDHQQSSLVPLMALSRSHSDNQTS
ncbi:hypothetical protein KIPB_011215, partial [Kipferlia bialata]|eukprot:g11215.t1